MKKLPILFADDDALYLQLTGDASKDTLNLAAKAGISRVSGKSHMAQEIREIFE